MTEYEKEVLEKWSSPALRQTELTPEQYYNKLRKQNLAEETCRRLSGFTSDSSSSMRPSWKPSPGPF